MKPDACALRRRFAFGRVAVRWGAKLDLVNSLQYNCADTYKSQKP